LTKGLRSKRRVSAYYLVSIDHYTERNQNQKLNLKFRCKPKEPTVIIAGSFGPDQTSLFSCAEPNSCIKDYTTATFDWVKFDRMD
jgi:hypothetical protein